MINNLYVVQENVQAEDIRNWLRLLVQKLTLWWMIYISPLLAAYVVKPLVCVNKKIKSMVNKLLSKFRSPRKVSESTNNALQKTAVSGAEIESNLVDLNSQLPEDKNETKRELDVDYDDAFDKVVRTINRRTSTFSELKKRKFIKPLEIDKNAFELRKFTGNIESVLLEMMIKKSQKEFMKENKLNLTKEPIRPFDITSNNEETNKNLPVACDSSIEIIKDSKIQHSPLGNIGNQPQNSLNNSKKTLDDLTLDSHRTRTNNEKASTFLNSKEISNDSVEEAINSFKSLEGAKLKQHPQDDSIENLFKTTTKDVNENEESLKNQIKIITYRQPGDNLKHLAKHVGDLIEITDKIKHLKEISTDYPSFKLRSNANHDSDEEIFTSREPDDDLKHLTKELGDSIEIANKMKHLREIYDNFQSRKPKLNENRDKTQDTGNVNGKQVKNILTTVKIHYNPYKNSLNPRSAVKGLKSNEKHNNAAKIEPNLTLQTVTASKSAEILSKNLHDDIYVLKIHPNEFPEEQDVFNTQNPTTKGSL